MKTTVIVPTHNRRDLLEVALRSLLRQVEGLDLDILVVDDGSTDGTAELLAGMRATHPVIRVVRQDNAGVCAARNTGLAHLLPETERLTFLDSDDVSPLGALAAQAACFDRDPDLDFAYGSVLMVDEIDPVSFEPAPDARTLALRCIQLSCALFARRFTDRIGRFDPDFRQAEDTDYFLRAFEAAPRFVETDTVCVYYRRHPGNMTKRLAESRSDFARALHKSMLRRRKDPAIRLTKPSFEIAAIATAGFY